MSGRSGPRASVPYTNRWTRRQCRRRDTARASRTGRRAQKAQPRLFGSADQFGLGSERLRRATKKSSRFPRRAPHWSRSLARRSTPGRSGASPVLPEHARVRTIASGASRRVASTPWPSRVIACAARAVQRSVGAIEVGHEKADRVGADVDRGELLHRGSARAPAQPTTQRRRGRHRPPDSTPGAHAGTSRPARAADSTRGPGPARPAASAASRSAAYARAGGDRPRKWTVRRLVLLPPPPAG